MNFKALKYKQIIAGIVAALMIITAIAPGVIVFVSGDDAGVAEDKAAITSGLKDYDPDGTSAADTYSKMMSDTSGGRNIDKNSFSYIISRVLKQGYINDVETGVLGDGATDIRYNGRYVCDPNSPQNLLSHNCDLPNIMANAIQSSFSTTGSSGMVNASRTESYQGFQIGVPSNAPTDMNTKHTALELFGYRLNQTRYLGEWDNINISTESRLLTNFSIFSTGKLIGASIFNGVKAGVFSLVKNFEWNPVRWWVRTVASASSGVVNTIIDTSDLNVAATYGWTRDYNFHRTLYGIYVLTNEQVASAGEATSAKAIANEFNRKLEEDPTLKLVLSLKVIPKFVYDSTYLTDESAAAIANWKIAKEVYDTCEALRNNATSEIIVCSDPGPEPAKVYYTEKEQFEFFMNSTKRHAGNKVKAQRTSGKTVNIDCDNSLDAGGSYNAALQKCWTKQWKSVYKKEFDAKNELIAKLYLDILVDYASGRISSNQKYYNPARAIGHYVCPDASGNLPENPADWVYLYSDENSGGTEYRNPACPVPRPTIAGGLFGNGFNRPSTDTRNVIFNEIIVANGGPITSTTKQAAVSNNSFWFTAASNVAAWLNLFVDMSFEPILTYLGIDEIVASIIEAFRDTIFIWFAALAACWAAFSFVYKVLATGSIRQFFTSILAVLFTFIVGTAVLMKPAELVKFIEVIPSHIDTFIVETLFNNNAADPLCSSGSNSSSSTDNAVRIIQCKIWQIMVFDPYVAAQWGTSFNNLYADGYAPQGGDSLRLDAATKDLVGEPLVNMGGGEYQRNWALYQLSLTKSGTINTKTQSRFELSIQPDKNLYRIVDAQAGPNGGAGRDDRYLRYWSGIDGNRSQIGFQAFILSLIIAFLIGSLCLLKIATSFTFAVMLVMLPLMLLVGVAGGQAKLKTYLTQLLSTFLKRVYYVFWLCFIIILITSISGTMSGSYTIIFISLLAVTIFLIIYRVTLENLIFPGGVSFANVKLVPAFVTTAIARKTAEAKGDVVSTVRGAGAVVGVAQRKAFTNIYNKVDEKRAQYEGTATTPIGGDYGNKSFSELSKEAFQAQKRHGNTISNRFERKQRLQGHTLLDTIAKPTEAVERLKQEKYKKPGTTSKKPEIMTRQEITEVRDNEKRKKKLEKEMSKKDKKQK